MFLQVGRSLRRADVDGAVGQPGRLVEQRCCDASSSIQRIRRRTAAQTPGAGAIRTTRVETLWRRNSRIPSWSEPVEFVSRLLNGVDLWW